MCNPYLPGMKILDGSPEYIIIEQADPELKPEEWKQGLSQILLRAKKQSLQRIQAVLLRDGRDYENLANELIGRGFVYYSSKVDVYRNLSGLKDQTSMFQWLSLKDETLTEAEFIEIWRECMLLSDNAPSSLTMEQHLQSVKKELGSGWEYSCRVFYDNKGPKGISIPHIEPGTSNEGRLFYFGVLPQERFKGSGTKMHGQSLSFLKEMGAEYYIGSTHLANQKMQRVFEKNGCEAKAYTDVFYKCF
ncbi:GNAT family N-acetyltransferase [Fictibacillus terranigra]|uniref:GNAT family N-acetyltransferase n=1 Tax=Fictibacillus terranigra TaxID=3058424 RepID=A0ABT8E8J3_9BACL|nr:GNAT family N-acetyltransferase [Fictibacillus sp. CENA-BCM004]MDN4074243.1 GNAT family N-acetyltransferase [Fictibacillus sp. CENA-BCM004]